MTSPEAARGPLLRQPARVVVTLGLAAMIDAGRVDIPKLRDALVDWWDVPALRQFEAPPPREPTMVQTPAAPGRPAALGVKPAGGLVDDARLPPALREMAKRMGGVPAWWQGSGTVGDLNLPADLKRAPGKLQRAAKGRVDPPPPPAVSPPPGVDLDVYAEAVAEVDRIDRPPEAVIADG